MRGSGIFVPDPDTGAAGSGAAPAGPAAGTYAPPPAPPRAGDARKGATPVPSRPAAGPAGWAAAAVHAAAAAIACLTAGMPRQGMARPRADKARRRTACAAGAAMRRNSHCRRPAPRLGKRGPFTTLMDNAGYGAAPALLLATLAAAWWPARAAACGMEYYPSGHFNTLMPDFGNPPRPFGLYAYSADYRPTPDNKSTGSWATRFGDDTDPLEAILDQAARLERRGRYAAALGRYRRYLLRAPRRDFPVYPREDREPRVRDRIEVLGQVTPRTDRRLLARYLAARDLYDEDQGPRAEEPLRRLYNNRGAGFLRAHALYALASVRYSAGDSAAAGVLYRRLAIEFPHAAKREAALIMAIRCVLGVVPSANRAPETWAAVWPSPAALKRGRELLHEFLAQYPRSRFRSNALGWQGRCEMASGRIPEAFCIYLRQLAAAPTIYDSLSAIGSISYVRGRITAADARRFSRLLIANPDLIVPYLDYRLYHCGQSAPTDFAHLSRLGETLAGLRPRPAIPMPILVRLAQVNYKAGRYRPCAVWAQRALDVPAGRGGEFQRDYAYYLRGAARHRLGNLSGALADFSRVYRHYPRSFLRPAARENLAILYEERGDLGSALEHYLGLGYEGDTAFLLDARMSIAEIVRFLDEHPRHPQRALVRYSLGIRCLRAGRLDQAERALRSLPAGRGKELAISKGAFDDEAVEHQLRDPLKAVADLRRLRTAIRRAPQDNRRAEALYALASYYYDNRNLLLYNVALWKGMRASLFDFCWNTDHATQGDDGASQRHHYEHECVNCARLICLEIAARYPRSPAAPKALYRAGCCARRLADFSHWWRAENKRHDFWKESERSMRRVAARYPQHPLAANARKYAAVFRREARGW